MEYSSLETLDDAFRAKAEHYIRKYTPWIKSRASSISHKYRISYEDAYSLVLEGFLKALPKYDDKVTWADVVSLAGWNARALASNSYGMRKRRGVVNAPLPENAPDIVEYREGFIPTIDGLVYASLVSSVEERDRPVLEKYLFEGLTWHEASGGRNTDRVKYRICSALRSKYLEMYPDVHIRQTERERPTCMRCGSSSIKAKGRNKSNGAPRYFCNACSRVFTPPNITSRGLTHAQL